MHCMAGQVTVVFLANVEALLPSKEDWPSIWVEQQTFKRAKAEHDAAQAKQVQHMLSACRSNFGSDSIPIQSCFSSYSVSVLTQSKF